jgi:hypothetical protein
MIRDLVQAVNTQRAAEPLPGVASRRLEAPTVSR